MPKRDLFYVIHIDEEDPRFSDLKFFTDKGKEACIKWIKDNFWDFYSGEQPDWSENPSQEEIDEYYPMFIEDFDENEVASELSLYIRSAKENIVIDSEKV